MAATVGFVDTIDVDNGTRGWAVDTADLGRPVRLQLCVGPIVVAEVETRETRDDISIKFGRKVAAGFVFDTETMVSLPGLALDQDDDVFVRFADSQIAVEAGIALPKSRTIAGQALSLAKPPPPPDSMDLEMVLDGLRVQAQPLVQLSLTPSQDGLRGYIETLVVDPAGVVWFVGWMKGGHPPEFGGVLSEEGKHPAAVAMMGFHREDLPGDAKGILGIMATDWRPGAETHDLQFYFGVGGRHHLRAHTPLRIISFKELLSDYASIRERCINDRHTGSLQRMLASLESWLPGRTAGLRYGTESSLDRALLIPGLGCLVEGWVMSPMKRIEGLRMRVGSSVMTARQESLYWKPRPDLAAAFPRSETMTKRAGFIALFSGQGDTSDLADPVMKIIFEGGGSANWDIPPHIFRRLGHSAAIEDALSFFPALQDEPFFPRFARAAIAVQREAIAGPVTLRAATPRSGLPGSFRSQEAPGAIVMVLPEDRCDVFLMFEEVAQRCRSNAPMPELIFVASAGANRSDALWLFREFEEATAIRSSLMLLDEAGHALAALPAILREAQVDRFLFVGAGMFLTASGWAQAEEVLGDGRSDLVLFGLEPDQSEPFDPDASITARCFAWSQTPFEAWSGTAPPFFGGFHRDNGLRRATKLHSVNPGAVRTTRALVPTRICSAVNEAVYLQQVAA